MADRDDWAGRIGPVRLAWPLRPLRTPGRVPAALALLAIIAALVWTATTPFVPTPKTRSAAEQAEKHIGDLELYRRIADRVRGGENYYAVAVDEQRNNYYPTRPFVTVRPPTLALLDAAFGLQAMRGALAVLLLLACLAWYGRLAGVVPLWARVGAVMVMAASGSAVFEPRSGFMHEIPAGLLLALAMALYRPRRWWPSLLLVALALAIREFALPFALLWFAFAFAEKRWREAAAIAALIALFAIGMWMHYLNVQAFILPGDERSPGWEGLEGIPFVLRSLARVTPLIDLPLWLYAPLALLPLLGWAGLGGRLGLFATLWFGGYLGGMALFARESNFYWALMVLPAYGAGLGLVPLALADLVAALRGPPLALRRSPG